MADPGKPHPIAGIVILNKPVGASSAQYVYRLRPILGVRKVGHAGTLDPFAEGVLLGCVGRGTRLVESLMALPKHYRTTLRLGVTNETFDTERPFESVTGAVPLSRSVVEAAVGRFAGEIDQVPPDFSAVKVGGVAGYRLAKRGLAVRHKARRTRIDRIEIIEYAWPTLCLEVACGRGTYIRAIARDLGERLGCGACCETLTRAAVGPFTLDRAVRLETATPQEVCSALLPLDE
ncbi:MAG: tRNA pseudouridine(55) synthase TruB, partial [Phycisphaerae bacterium]